MCATIWPVRAFTSPVCNAHASFETQDVTLGCNWLVPMGKNPLYPFDIPPPVVTKPGFVHRVVRETAQARR
jgi:hypothetical protein